MTTDTDVLRRFRLRTATFCMVMLVAALTSCAGQADPPLGSTPPPGQPALPIGTVAPQYGELPMDHIPDPASTVPWQLVRVDRQENRIYLSASSSGCSHPNTVRVTETASSIQVTVTGTGGGDPCSMQYVTLIGYVQLSSIGDREITGNAS
ncbi:hypothetical protein M8J71_20480 [Pseudarthrobacter sp. R1]|uniref:hypothetical protein n=1 Tax=Pseudarthrobacter sp. R1 TaxID=2944934 RepID=UPI00210C8CFD|nr:hypothetical protein [Pseudarthrobacter sp. R1]MCQ6272838.1 hypothetical protein [Pseudarthrobacter sp. R1]